MIDLNGVTPFAEGGNRRCFVHPNNPNRCLKVIHSGLLETIIKNKPWYKKLRSAESFDDNLRERDAYNFIDEVRQANQYELNVIKGTLGEKILIKGEFLIGDILSYNNQIIHGSVFLKDIVAAGPKKVYNAA